MVDRRIEIPGRQGFPERNGFAGDIHLINPKRATIGARECLVSVEDLPFGVDIAVLAIPKVSVLGAVARLVAALGRLLIAHPKVRELDLNPVVVYPDGEGLVALDALMLIEQGVAYPKDCLLSPVKTALASNAATDAAR